MVFPDAVALYVKRCPGVSVNRYIGRLPNSQVVTPSAHIQIQLPKVDAMDTRSAQILCDVSTASSTGTFVMPRYGAQMLIESSVLICGGRTIGGQSNQYYNIWNHIKQEFTAGVQDQPKMSIFAGGADIPPLGSTATTVGTYDVNGTYTPPTITSYKTPTWSMGSQTNALQPGQTNLLALDATTKLPYYSAGQPQVIEVFNETLESVQPELLPTIMMQNLYADLGFGAANMLIGPATGSTVTQPSYQIQNIALQCTTYDLGQAFRDFHISYVNQGNVLEMPFKSVQAWPGPLNTVMDTQLNFTCGSQSVDMLVACFLDGTPLNTYRNWGPVVAGTNTSKYFTLGKGTGVRHMNWVINGQNNPQFQVTPKSAYGQTSNDWGLSQIGHGCYKNLNSFLAYLTQWFVWGYSTSLPFKESMQRAIAGLDTMNQNAQLSLVVTSDPTQTAAQCEPSYANIPLVFIVSTSSLLVGQGGQVNVVP